MNQGDFAAGLRRLPARQELLGDFASGMRARPIRIGRLRLSNGWTYGWWSTS